MKLTIDLNSFYSLGDERRFFQGLNENPAVSGFRGVGRQLQITIVQNRLTRVAILDLIALCRRYQIPLTPLSQIAEKDRFAWLKDEKWSWYKSMFTTITDGNKPGNRTRSEAEMMHAQLLKMGK
ncbi:hypothetical protein, partial [Massilia scottii]|uniref:hypothetical protein n=1 Tax=Massilia scottii TaxID=3057166 RepID=UPI002796CD16